MGLQEESAKLDTALRKLGNAILEALHIEQMVEWLSDKLKGE